MAAPVADQNVENSTAYATLDELKSSGDLTPANVEVYKSKYATLQEAVVEIFEDETSLMKRAKVLNQELLGERIKLEKLGYRRGEEETVTQSLHKQREEALKEVDECNERDQVLQFELQELERTKADLQRDVEQMRQENAAMVQPELLRLQEESNNLRQQLTQQENHIEGETKRKDEFAQKIEQLRDLREDLNETRAAERHTLNKLRNDPERIRKQADVVQKAAENLDAEVKRLRERLAGSDAELQHQQKKKREADEVSKDLGRKLELHRDTIDQREQDVESVQKNLEFEKTQYHDALTRRAELELSKRGEDDKLKRVVESLGQTNKLFERNKKELKRKRIMLDAVTNTIPQLRMQLHDAGHQLESFRSQNRQYRTQLSELKQEVDIFIARFLRQEQVEASKADELRALMQQIKGEESDIQQWSNEEHKQNKMIAMLSAQREVKAREASKAARNEKETQEDLKMKELVILDLTKKCNETNNRLKEFSALYDVVKNERNKYVNLIQASSQAVAEMKEKIKILQNEVEILRNESLAKDKALAKERLAHQTAQCNRDGLRLETNKCQAIYRQKQEQVEQQIVEIDKLNNIINAMEKEMLGLKRDYEHAVEQRNYTGVQLIDRNDELCILYEKSNIQEATLKQGEIGIREREEEIRMLNLQLAELQRQIEVTRKQMPKMPEYAEQILGLQQELSMEREMTEMLCRDLETPSNEDRWRPLGGEDPDTEQLVAKVQVLEERLNDKKEQLLEKELVLEEVTSLSDKLRTQAADGRGDTLKLAKNVNDFQSRIKETTRKMMATVSELSMYQATAMKLQQEKHDREMEMEDAQWRSDNGQPPTEHAEHEWYRMERERLRKQEEMFRKQLQGAGALQPAQVTRTTAEPRPNAYIPDDIGIPKPYGGLAPFKPSEAGANMRHMRKPQPREIEI